MTYFRTNSKTSASSRALYKGGGSRLRAAESEVFGAAERKRYSRRTFILQI